MYNLRLDKVWGYTYKKKPSHYCSYCPKFVYGEDRIVLGNYKTIQKLALRKIVINAKLKQLCKGAKTLNQ